MRLRQLLPNIAFALLALVCSSCGTARIPPVDLTRKTLWLFQVGPNFMDYHYVVADHKIFLRESPAPFWGDASQPTSYYEINPVDNATWAQILDLSTYAGNKQPPFVPEETYNCSMTYDSTAPAGTREESCQWFEGEHLFNSQLQKLEAVVRLRNNIVEKPPAWVYDCPAIAHRLQLPTAAQ